MNDKDLRQRVIDQLDWEPSLDSANVAVAVHAGIVTLTGHVPTYLQKITAERLVRGIKGVLGIAQDIEVRLQGADPSSDEDIAKRAVTSIAFDSHVPPDTLQVKVSKGWVTLLGELEWHYQRSAAEADVRKLRGVVGVINAITLKPHPHAGDIARADQGSPGPRCKHRCAVDQCGGRRRPGHPRRLRGLLARPRTGGARRLGGPRRARRR